MPRRTQPPRPPAAPPATAAEGTARIRAMLVPVFDRKDGTGADCPLLLESVFQAAFQFTDARPDDDARRALLRRVYTGAYERTAGETGSGQPAAPGAGVAPSHNSGLKGPAPRPPR